MLTTQHQAGYLCSPTLLGPIFFIALLRKKEVICILTAFSRLLAIHFKEISILF